MVDSKMRSIQASYLRDSGPPTELHGTPVWDRKVGRWTIRFAGRGADWSPGRRLEPLQPPATELAWLEQRHTARLTLARPGNCGVADALAVESPGIAALVVTADCVPVVIATAARAVLVHAGWRGIAAALPRQAAAQAVAAAEPGAETAAWIGPAIGPCCYEVGDEVAAAVAAESGAACVERPAGGRPRVDLRRAVGAQLQAAGVRRISWLDQCTRCRPEWLWSYRREGAGAGRNLSLLWRLADAEPASAAVDRG